MKTKTNVKAGEMTLNYGQVQVSYKPQ